MVTLNQAAHAQAFVHPGLLHTNADFTRMANEVAAQTNPWYQGFELLANNSHAQASYSPRPTADVDRGGSINNYAVFYNDIAAAYQLALRWKVTGDVSFANASIGIMNAWSSTLTQVTGDADRYLAFGIYGYEFANAGEIMRTYSGWAPSDFARFQNMMMNIFYPGNNDFLVNHNNACIWNYWANWDLCNIASMAAIGVLCDNRAVYNQALNYFKQPVTGNPYPPTNGGQGTLAHFCWATYLNSSTTFGTDTLIQGQEEGRDQGHSGLDFALLGVIAQQFYNQGDDMFVYTFGSATQPGSVQSPGPANAILAAAEYFADYNLNGTNTVPFTTYWTALGPAPCGGATSQTVISSNSRGDVRPAWQLLCAHYHSLKGFAAPFVTQYTANVRPEGGGGNYGTTSGGFDQLGFGTLTYTLTAGNPVASGYYGLQNRADSSSLDDYSSTSSGSPVYQYTYEGTAQWPQTWHFSQISGSTYNIISSTGLYLDSLGHTGNASTVGQSTANGSSTQQWVITNVGGGYYTLKNVASGLCLDTGGLIANSSVLEMWASGSSYNQQWFLHGEQN